MNVLFNNQVGRCKLIAFPWLLWQKSMNRFMRSGQQNDVLYVDGLKIGTTTKSSYATGIDNMVMFIISWWLTSNCYKGKYLMLYISIRCQIAVHQECYGARHVRDFTSWVCKACEKPEVKRECCLCPVKGNFFSSQSEFVEFYVYEVLVCYCDVIFWSGFLHAVGPQEVL